jgi:hypothetical protein
MGVPLTFEQRGHYLIHVTFQFPFPGLLLFAAQGVIDGF